MENTEHTCFECGDDSVKQGESIAFQMQLIDDAGNPLINLADYTISVSIRSSRTLVLSFEANDDNSIIHTEIDEDGYIAFLLDGVTTSSLLPGGYFLEIKINKNNSVIKSNSQRIFTLMHSDPNDLEGY